MADHLSDVPRDAMHRPIWMIVWPGLAGLVVFECIAWGLAPGLLGRPIEPAILVRQLVASLFDIDVGAVLAFLIHLASGLVVFPAGYVVLLAVFGLRPGLLSGVIWGVVLWFLAQGVFAPLAGRPFMMGFGQFTLVSLIVHTIYAVVVAAVYARLARRSVTPAF